MNDLPLVSIVTPSFNQAQYLEQTIRSVLAQPEENSPAFRLEYIIVDGGSTDGSQEIIAKYAHRLAWWVSEADEGQAQAINKGFRHSHGEILAWLNSDDLYLPSAVSQAVKALQANPRLGFVFGDALSIDAQGRPIHRLSFGDWNLSDLIRFRVICQPAVFFRRSVWELAGGLDESFHYMLDHQLWIKLARVSEIQHIPALWAAARQHPQAKNVAQAARFGEETQQIYEWMLTQPDLGAMVRRHERQVRAGVFRLTARYLLDGGAPAQALRTYLRAIGEDPLFALKHWHRMIFALLSLAGAGRLRGFYEKISRRRQYRRLRSLPLQNWHGILIEENELE